MSNLTFIIKTYSPFSVPFCYNITFNRCLILVSKGHRVNLNIVFYKKNPENETLFYNDVLYIYVYLLHLYAIAHKNPEVPNHMQ